MSKNVVMPSERRATANSLEAALAAITSLRGALQFKEARIESLERENGVLRRTLDDASVRISDDEEMGQRFDRLNRAAIAAIAAWDECRAKGHSQLHVAMAELCDAQSEVPRGR